MSPWSHPDDLALDRKTGLRSCPFHGVGRTQDCFVGPGRRKYRNAGGTLHCDRLLSVWLGSLKAANALMSEREREREKRSAEGFILASAGILKPESAAVLEPAERRDLRTVSLTGCCIVMVP